MSKKTLVFLIGFVFIVSCLFANTNPEAISPGNEVKASIVNQICPTFSWAYVPGAVTYQIAVFEMRERYEGLSYYENQAALSQPVLVKNVYGTASSWTPSLEEALNNGGCYVWFVQALDNYGSGTWSVGKKFVVRSSMGLTEIKKKVKKKLESLGVKEGLVDEAFEGLQSQNIKKKEGRELKGKNQSEKEEKSKGIRQENKEIKGKENQNSYSSGDSVAGDLGDEGDANGNTYYGYMAGSSLTINALLNSFFGCYAGFSVDKGDGNTFVGNSAGYYNTTGNANTFIGGASGHENTEGQGNTIIGAEAGFSNVTGLENTFVGVSAGTSNITGSSNTFIGGGAGHENTEGQGNTILGYCAGYNSSGNDNIFLGFNAGYNENGSNKLYVENSDSSTPLIYGEFDNDLLTINGHLSVHEGGYLGLTGNTNQLTVDTTSSRARFKLQADGGGTNTDDFFNFTMRNDYGDVTLSVRDSSASVWLPMLSYEYLNNKVDFKDNDIVTTGTISSGGGAYTSGGAWIEASSRDYKENIMELGQAESLLALERLNPVRYNYTNNKEEEFLGFIAEEVPDLVAMNGRRGMRAMDIVAVLTKVAQEQQKTIENLKKEVSNLKEEIRKNFDQ